MCSARFDDDVVVAPRGVPSGGRLTVPTDARGIVMSAGIGADARHRWPVRSWASARLATLRFELLSDEELRDDHDDADVELLAIRFLAVTRWVRQLPACAGLPVGYLGAGAAGVAAMWAASEDREIGAVVARDSRLELVRSSPPGGLRTHAAPCRHRGPGGTAAERAVRTPVAVRTSHRRGPRGSFARRARSERCR